MSQLPEAQAMLQSDYNRGPHAPRGYKTERIRFRQIPHEFLLNLRNRPCAEVRWSDAFHNCSFSSYIKKIVIGKTQFFIEWKLVLVAVPLRVHRPSSHLHLPSTFFHLRVLSLFLIFPPFLSLHHKFTSEIYRGNYCRVETIRSIAFSPSTGIILSYLWTWINSRILRSWVQHWNYHRPFSPLLPIYFRRFLHLLFYHLYFIFSLVIILYSTIINPSYIPSFLLDIKS